MKLSNLPVLALLVFISSCSKNYTVPSSTSQVAIGNGSTAYMPLTIGDTWNYYPTWTTSVTAQSGTVYTLNDNQTVSDIWVDSTKEYVMEYTGNPLACAGVSFPFSSPQAFVYIPAVPTAGQAWTATVGTGITLNAKVVSTNTSIATSIYGYTNCLEISYTYTYASGSVTMIKYFSKGVGMVYNTVTVNDYAPVYCGVTSFVVS